MQGTSYVHIINQEFSKYFVKQTNMQEIFCTQTLCASTDVKMSTVLEETGGMRLWFTKWTFQTSSNGANFCNTTNEGGGYHPLKTVKMS